MKCSAARKTMKRSDAYGYNILRRRMPRIFPEIPDEPADAHAAGGGMDIMLPKIRAGFPDKFYQLCAPMKRFVKCFFEY